MCGTPKPLKVHRYILLAAPHDKLEPPGATELAGVPKEAVPYVSAFGYDSWRNLLRYEFRTLE